MWIKKIKALDAHEQFSLNGLAPTQAKHPCLKLKHKKKKKTFKY